MKKIPYDQNQKTELTQKEIDAFKTQYGGVYLIEVDDKKCYLHSPTRQILDAAAVAGKKAESKFNEVIIRGCWLAGNKELLEDDAYFLSVSTQLSEIIEIKEAVIKKL